MIEEAGALDLWKEAEGLGHVQSGEEAASEALNTYMEDMEKMDPDSSPWCVIGKWKIGLNWNKSGSD